GAFLSRNGIKVTVLEKNSIIGGGLQCFRRKDKFFETGMHVMGGFEEGGNLYKICKYLGILDSLKIHHVDCQCMDEIRYEKSRELFRIPSGKDAFIARMSEYFPHEADGIREYVDELYRLTEEVPLFYLKEEPKGISIHSEKFSWPADKLISHYVTDKKLQELLAYLNPLYGGVEGHTPAYIHALINVLYINGASRFIDGSQQLADALKAVINDHGGDVISNCEVTKIEVVDKMVHYVQTSRGERFSGDWYVSSIHPVEILKMVPQGTFLKGFITRLNNIPNSYSAFSLFVDLKPQVFPYINHTCYYLEDFGSIWNLDKYEGMDWPKGFMYMTPPDSNQGEFATKLLVHCIMSYEQVKKWENTVIGCRGKSYEQWKESCINRILDKLSNVFPGFRKMVANVYAASPLTIRDYYHTKEGAIFGYRKDCENLIFSQLPVYTKVKNFLLTGQNIILHGICGVPLTAINTSEAILGTNTLVNQINDSQNN
ncbi:MAG: FAD-dependent oxidoreductase, partial [Muribaculaceae bacterium]|nr:FAD-dependent oxidoreductase [Muribaculaceae bacterium]